LLVHAVNIGFGPNCSLSCLARFASLWVSLWFQA